MTFDFTFLNPSSPTDGDQMLCHWTMTTKATMATAITIMVKTMVYIVHIKNSWLVNNNNKMLGRKVARDIAFRRTHGSSDSISVTHALHARLRATEENERLRGASIQRWTDRESLVSWVTIPRYLPLLICTPVTALSTTVTYPGLQTAPAREDDEDAHLVLGNKEWWIESWNL